MTNIEAIDNRRSRRLYLDSPIEAQQIDVLQGFIEKFNKESGLTIRFVEDGSTAFNGFLKSYGL